MGVLPHALESLPNNAITLESRAKGYLPNPVAFPYPGGRFQVSQFIPNAAARGVAESLQCPPRCFHVFIGEVEVLLYLVEDLLAGRQDADMVEGELIIGKIRLGRLLFEEEVVEEVKLFGNGEHEGAEGGDVVLERVPSYSNHVLAHGKSSGTSGIFLHTRASEAPFFRAFMSTNKLQTSEKLNKELLFVAREKDQLLNNPFVNTNGEVGKTCLSSYLERHLSRWRLESKMAAAPIRKKQFGRSMSNSLPSYQV